VGAGAAEAGTPLAAPKPVFRKLEPTVVTEELARLDQGE
jgi:methionyl-tRNA synthetase